MTGFDDRVRAAARALDRPDALAEFLAYRAVEDEYHERTVTPDGRAALDAAASGISQIAPLGRDRDAVARARATSAQRHRIAVERRSAEPDLETLADAAAESEAAREELAVRLWPVLARYCAARLNGTSSVPLDGVVQDVLRSVLERLPDRGDRPVLLHAYTVAARCTPDHLRRNARRGGPAQADDDMLVDQLNTLPRGQRDVLVLRILLGCSVDETAEHLGTTPDAVRLAQHRAWTTVRRAGAVDL